MIYIYKKKSMDENHHKSNNFGLAFFACVLFLLFFHHHYCVFNSYQWKVINYIWTFEFSSLIHYWVFLAENHKYLWVVIWSCFITNRIRGMWGLLYVLKMQNKHSFGRNPTTFFKAHSCVLTSICGLFTQV